MHPSKEVTINVTELNAGIHLVEAVTGSGVQVIQRLVIGGK